MKANQPRHNQTSQHLQILALLHHKLSRWQNPANFTNCHRFTHKSIPIHNHFTSQSQIKMKPQSPKTNLVCERNSIPRTRLLRQSVPQGCATYLWTSSSDLFLPKLNHSNTKTLWVIELAPPGLPYIPHSGLHSSFCIAFKQVIPQIIRDSWTHPYSNLLYVCFISC